MLFTGKGGVGNDHVGGRHGRARRARRPSHAGGLHRRGHSLADAFGGRGRPEPTEVAPRLWMHQVDAQRSFERSWGDIQAT